MFCDFDSLQIADSQWLHTCKLCGTARKAPTPTYVRTCDKGGVPGCGIVAKAKAVATAHAKWIAAGSPNRTPERVAEIFDTICRPCENFIPDADGSGTCKLCGCALRRAGGLLNKIRMATEGCVALEPKWNPEA